MRAVVLGVLGVAMMATPYALADDRFAKLAEKKLYEVEHYSEGVVFDHEGNGYLSQGDTIMKFTQDGAKIEAWSKTGAPNGHKILADGTHLVCDASHHAVLHLAADGTMMEPASKECDGKPLRGPNDLTLDTQNGGFYFTDPGMSGRDNPIGTLHYVDRDGKTHLIAGGFAFPNGVVLSADGKTLYMAESQKNRVLVFKVVGPGKCEGPELFVDLPAKDESAGQIDNQPDGMCLDSEGNLYVAHYGMRQVQVISPEGTVIGRLPGGNLTTSNVAFAGPEMKTLFVTGALAAEQGSKGGLFTLEMPVKGLTILPPK